MSRIRAFRGLRYDPARVDLDRVIVPPYDVIAAEERDRWYERDPHNAIRLELTRHVREESGTDYAEVRRTLDAWHESGVLARDRQPSVYGLRQHFRAPDDGEHVREGFLALLHLEDYAAGVVRPHERTLAGPKADRLKQIRAARANLSVVFLLYEDRESAVAKALAPAFGAANAARFEDPNGAVHILAPCADSGLIGSVRDAMAGRPLVIADGHHRYETALAYRDECRQTTPNAGSDAPHEWILAYFANAFAPGTLLLPIHRLIRKSAVPTDAAWIARLPGWEQKSVPARSAEAMPDLLDEHLSPLRGRHAFAADDASGVLRIFSRPADDELSVRVIHREVIEGVFELDEAAVREGAIDYPKSAAQTARDVRSGRGTVALYLNPLTPGDVFRVTAAGEVMPQKSTFFFPKLPSGLVFRRLSDDEQGAA